MPAAVLGDIRDGLRDDAKQCQARAEQITADPVRAALCRGQALAYTAAAEHIDAAISGAILPHTLTLARPRALVPHQPPEQSPDQGGGHAPGVPDNS